MREAVAEKVQTKKEIKSTYKVVLNTSMGNITIKLDDATKETTNNFLVYVNNGFYDNTIFHRVIKDFVVQGGGFTEDMQQKPTAKPIKNEADLGQKNTRGTVAMARTPVPHSATAQFFINLRDNPRLDFKNKIPDQYGYCVFGEVIEGLEIVDKISEQKTDNKNGHRDVPVEPIIIKSAEIFKFKPAPKI